MNDVMVGALGNTVAGIGTVFIVLILISLIIYCFNIIPVIQGMFTKKPEAKAETKVSAPAAPAPVVTASEEVPVAAIMAAIYAYEEANGYVGNGFYVRSIKRRK